jgi:hypothetical protein
MRHDGEDALQAPDAGIPIMIAHVPSTITIPPPVSSLSASVPFGGPQLIVLDSGVIYDDIVHRLRCPEKSCVLIRSAQSGATRLLAGDHVYDEIYDSLDGHERRGIARRDLIECYERVYLPHLRFVATPLWPVPDRVLPVAADDPDDVQTAMLALLLAPSLVFAVDPHLVRAGFGRAEDWLTLAWKADELLGYDGVLFLTGLAARAGARWLNKRARAIAAELRGPEIVLGVLLGLGLHLTVPAASRTVATTVERAVRAASVAAGYTMLGVGQIAGQSGQAHGGLSAASVAPDPTLSTINRIARHLAMVDATVPLEQLAEVVSMEQLSTAALLDAHAAFVFDGNGWQLGRRRLPRGRELALERTRDDDGEHDAQQE